MTISGAHIFNVASCVDDESFSASINCRALAHDDLFTFLVAFQHTVQLQIIHQSCITRPTDGEHVINWERSLPNCGGKLWPM
jgi:hypothetical protein